MAPRRTIWRASIGRSSPGSTTSRCSILPKVIEPNVEPLYKHDLGIVHTRTRNYEQARSLGVFHVTKVTLAARRIREILCQRAELSAASVSPPNAGLCFPGNRRLASQLEGA